MKPKDSARDYDVVVGNLLIGSALLLLLCLPCAGVWGVGSGPRWAAESRFQMLGGSVLTATALFAGCSLRGRSLARKLLCFLMAALLSAGFLLRYQSPMCSVACLVVAGALGVSIYVNWVCPTPVRSTHGLDHLSETQPSNGQCHLSLPTLNGEPRAPSKKAVDLLVRNPKGSADEIVFKDTPIPVLTVLARLAEGEGFEDVLQAFPSLTTDHLLAAVAYAAGSAVESQPAPSVSKAQ